MAHTPRNQSEKATLAARRAWCYLVLVLISFLCLFFFYVLVINSTRTHFEIQKGFSLLPGKSLITNFQNVLADANIPVVSGIRNSLIVSACSAALSVYFSALTAYGIYAYNFKFKKAAFAIILLIMTMPTQVSALGFLQLITKMGLKNSFIPLILPSIAAPTVFFFYVLIINSTRTHFEIQKGFSLMPGKSIITNFRNVLTDANIPVISGIRNSLLVSACSAALSVYFSALTAYGIYAYNFKFKKAAFALILLIMTMPTQVSALGFLQLISKMGLKNSFIPLIVPSIAAPTVFFFMKQYLDASLPMEIVEIGRAHV